MRISLEERPDLGLKVTQVRGYRDEKDKAGVIIGYIYEEEDGWYGKAGAATLKKKFAGSEEAIAHVVMQCMMAGGA